MQIKNEALLKKAKKQFEPDVSHLSQHPVMTIE